MSLSRLKSQVRKAKTEKTEVGRVVAGLAKAGHQKNPEKSESRTDDGRTVRMYLWRDTPFGNLCLVTGPSFDGELHELVNAKGVPAKGIYYPARNGKPALTRKSRKANPQARVGKVRTDKKTGKKYVLWRPVMPDGSRPRIYLDADKPKDAELVDVQEAAEQLEASKKVIHKKEKEAKRKGLRGIWKFGTGRKIVQSAPKRKPMLRASSATPLFDSEGKEYRATYMVIDTDKDGNGPIMASNLPVSFAETPEYPTVFQARSLQRAGETQKIQKISSSLDPDRLLLPHSDATLGAPVVWEGDGKSHKAGGKTIKTEKGRYYVLGGNGRTIALLMAPSKRYQSYIQRGKSLWPDVWPTGRTPKGQRAVLVRLATKPDGSPLSFSQARTLAGRTQKSASGEESPIGRAISMIRSLGIENVHELPPFRWTGIITQDNVADFVSDNDAYARAVFKAMGAARAESYKQDEALTASLFNDLMVGYLPRKFQLEGFVSEKQERTLLTALPILLTIHRRVEQGLTQPKWDLFPLLSPALRFSQAIKGKTDKQAVEMVEAAASQVQLGEGTGVSEKFKSLFDELPMLAVLLGIVLKKGEGTRDPALTVEKFLVPYAEKAMQAGFSPPAGQMGLLAAPGQADEGSDPVQILAKIMKVSLPRKARTNPPQMMMGKLFDSQVSSEGAYILDVIRRSGHGGFAANAEGDFPPGVEEVVRKGFAMPVACAAAEETVFGRETCTLELTKRGKSFLRDRGKAMIAEETAKQTRLFNPDHRKKNVVGLTFDPHHFSGQDAIQWCRQKGIRPLRLRKTDTLILIDLVDPSMIGGGTLQKKPISPGIHAMLEPITRDVEVRS